MEAEVGTGDVCMCAVLRCARPCVSASRVLARERVADWSALPCEHGTHGTHTHAVLHAPATAHTTAAPCGSISAPPVKCH
eukprot:scaffold14251_cov114-Isochrysis_galbana.AAC.2